MCSPCMRIPSDFSLQIKSAKMADQTEKFLLVQWEDRFMSVISIKDVVRPKGGSNDYMPGERIEATFQRKSTRLLLTKFMVSFLKVYAP